MDMKKIIEFAALAIGAILLLRYAWGTLSSAVASTGTGIYAPISPSGPIVMYSGYPGGRFAYPGYMRARDRKFRPY